MTDILIIGGGLIGMLTARELRRAGADVCLIERADTGSESSWAGGGILSPLYPWQYPDAVTRLAAWSQRHYAALAAELREETGIDAEWTPNGLLVLDPGDMSEVRAWAQRWDAVMEIVSRTELAVLEPRLNPDYETGVWMPEIAQIRNPRLMAAVKAGLLRRGVRLETHTEVTAFRAEGGRITGVETSRGRYQANKVVVAGGAWSGKLLALLGLRVDIVPVKGQMILFQSPKGMVSRIVLGGGHYVIPRRDGHVLAGSTLEYVGFDKSTTEDALRELRTAALGLIPDLAACNIEKQWAGLRPGSPEGMPYIGACPGVEGLYLNTGHFRNGVVTGLASARLLADMILGRETIIDPQPYRPVLV